MGEPIRVYSVAKTIADCFKYRRRIGIQAAHSSGPAQGSGMRVVSNSR
jgi:hypothetical protein